MKRHQMHSRVFPNPPSTRNTSVSTCHADVLKCRRARLNTSDGSRRHCCSSEWRNLNNSVTSSVDASCERSLFAVIGCSRCHSSSPRPHPVNFFSYEKHEGKKTNMSILALTDHDISEEILRRLEKTTFFFWRSKSLLGTQINSLRNNKSRRKIFSRQMNVSFRPL